MVHLTSISRQSLSYCITFQAGLLQMLSSMDSSDSAPLDNPFVDIIPCNAFRLEPLVEGILTVDGEVIPCSTIQVSLYPTSCQKHPRCQWQSHSLLDNISEFASIYNTSEFSSIYNTTEFATI